ncbi:MAG: cytochrome c [Acidobacteria bacterium]|nr:cytochrome c [Acidobacteriota bacterium]
MKINRTVSISFVVLAILSISAHLVRAADDTAALYKTKCASCHAADGSGNTPVGKNLKIPDLTSADVQKKSDQVLADITEKGKGKMPPTKGITSEQAKQLVAHIRTLKK